MLVQRKMLSSGRVHIFTGRQRVTFRHPVMFSNILKKIRLPTISCPILKLYHRLAGSLVDVGYDWLFWLFPLAWLYRGRVGPYEIRTIMYRLKLFGCLFSQQTFYLYIEKWTDSEIVMFCWSVISSFILLWFSWGILKLFLQLSFVRKWHPLYRVWIGCFYQISRG